MVNCKFYDFPIMPTCFVFFFLVTEPLPPTKVELFVREDYEK